MQETERTRLDAAELKSEAKNLRVEQSILLSGTIYTIFDIACRKLYEMIQDNRPLPFDLEGAVFYYCSPSPTPKGKLIGSCGPTTASRLDLYTPKLMDLGVICTIDKGERSPEVYESIKRNEGVYLCASGGTGALLSACVEEYEEFALPELEGDSIKRMKVKDFPLVVAADCTGRNIFDIGKFKYKRM